MMAKLEEVSDSQLNRLFYSLWDFQQALSALTFLLDDVDYSTSYSHVELRRLRSYEASAVLAFARPFKVGAGQSQVSLKLVGLSLSTEENKIKKRLLAVRDRLVAHSDEELMHFRAYLVPLEVEGMPDFPQIKFDEGLLLEESEARALETLLRRLIREIGSALYQLSIRSPQLFERYKQPS